MWHLLDSEIFHKNFSWSNRPIFVFGSIPPFTWIFLASEIREFLFKLLLRFYLFSKKKLKILSMALTLHRGAQSIMANVLFSFNDFSLFSCIVFKIMTKLNCMSSTLVFKCSWSCEDICTAWVIMIKKLSLPQIRHIGPYFTRQSNEWYEI